MENQEAAFFLEQVLGHEFSSRELLEEALTHSSFSNERGTSSNNERLEFLGDAVLGLIVAELLMEKFPSANEGTLSKWRSSLVSRRMLAEIAVALQLGDYMHLGRGERRSGGEEKSSILAGTFEALFGAIYLDAGILAARRSISKVFEPLLAAIDTNPQVVDKKTSLQEKTQSHYKTVPEYRVVETWGQEHEKTFKVEIWIQGKPVTSATGKSKKEAEQQAASLALELMEF